MDLAKVVISIAAAVFLIRIVIQDFRIYRKADVRNLTQHLVIRQYYPLSLKEKADVHQDCLQKLTKVQSEISKSTLLKYIVDYSKYIFEQQKLLAEEKLKLEEDEGYLSFSTVKLHSIIANPRFSRQSLLKLACLTDESFDVSIGTGLFVVEVEDDQIIIALSAIDGFDSIEKEHYDEFIDKVSKEIFEGDPVTFRIESSSSYSDELNAQIIPHSPICFQRLLEEDLKGECCDTKLVSLTEFKNAPFNLYHTDSFFTWEYIGKFQNYHLVYAELRTGDYRARKCFSGIYTVVLEKDTLKKVARIAHAEGEVSMIDWEYSPAFELDGAVLTYRQSDSDNPYGKKIKVQINSNGCVNTKVDYGSK